jgi:hypothetical protein
MCRLQHARSTFDIYTKSVEGVGIAVRDEVPCCQVEHARIAGTLEHLAHLRVIKNVPFDDFNVVIYPLQIPLAPGRKIIVDCDIMALFQTAFCKRAPDEASTTCNQYQFGHG